MVKSNCLSTQCGIYSIFFPLVILVLCISGCATPNIQPFADGAATFFSSIRLANSEVESKFSPLAGTNEELKRMTDNFSRSAKIFNDMASLAASYSAALAELAAAGETGGEAAQKISDTVKGFPEFLGMQNPALIPATLGPLAVGNAIQKAAEYWNRVEAHEDLLSSIETADDAVKELAVAFASMYGRPQNGINRPYQDIIGNMAELERSSLLRRTGQKKLRFYTNSEKVESDAISTLKKNEALSKEVEATLKMRGRIRADVLAYYDKVQEINEWEVRQLALSYLIADFAKAWAQEHKRLLTWFKQCGGTRFLKNDCGQFSASSLSAFASDLKFVFNGVSK